MPQAKTIPLDTGALLDSMAAGLASDSRVANCNALVLVGVQTGGVWIADALAPRLAAHGITGFETGSLGISFYRDDFSRIGVNPRVLPSKLPEDLDDKVVILVDDILYTGRTIRAAMNELFDYGRPAAVVLAILVDRGGRELPVRADVVGTELKLGAGVHVKLLGPEPLVLEQTRDRSQT